eukprot:5548207-Amphidinium_carterae.1
MSSIRQALLHEARRKAQEEAAQAAEVARFALRVLGSHPSKCRALQIQTRSIAIQSRATHEFATLFAFWPMFML